MRGEGYVPGRSSTLRGIDTCDINCDDEDNNSLIDDSDNGIHLRHGFAFKW